jgi:glycosyltransferase involved in cell wall biosynthesis
VRILYVSQYYPPEMGAPASRVSQLARAWAADGHDVTVLTGFPNHPTGIIPPEYRGAPYIRREEDHGVHVVRTPIYAAPNKGLVKRSLNYLSYGASASLLGPWLSKPDVVIGTSPQFLTAVAGYWIAKAKRVPFVFEVRDLWPRSIVEVGAMPANSPIVKAMEQAEMFLYRHSDRIVAVTDSFVDEISARGIDRQRISVIKNGVDLGLFTPGPRDNAVREQLGLQGKFVATYVGTHGMAHGLGTILDAAALLKSDDRFRFVLVGEGADKQALVQRAQAEGLTNVLFIGQQPHAAIPDYVRAADATVVLLKAKDLFKTVIPSKIFEFMGAGRPIVIGVDGEARGLVEQSGGGVFVPPESAERLVTELRRLADHPAEAEAMGQRGRTFVEQHFSRGVLARRYVEILSAVAQGVQPRVFSEALPVERQRAA